MSYYLKLLLNHLEGDPIKQTLYFNRLEALSAFESIITQSVSLVLSNNYPECRLVFEFNKAILTIPNTAKCIKEWQYTLTSDDVISWLLSEISDKYKSHTNAMRVNVENSTVYIYMRR